MSTASNKTKKENQRMSAPAAKKSGTPPARESRSVGGPKSVTRPSSPLTITAPIQIDDLPDPIPSCPHRPLDECPCGQSHPGSWMIDCSKCKQNWHVECVSLNGLDDKMIPKLVDYLCPFCYVAPIPTLTSDSNADLCNTCRNTAVLQKANNQYETNLASDYQSKISLILESTKQAFEENERLTKKLNERLSQLSEELSLPQRTPDTLIDDQSHDDKVPLPDCTESTISAYEKDFLSEEQSQDILTFLENAKSNGEFTQKNGRLTLAYGVPYRWATIYNGDKTEKKIPEELKPLIQKAQEACGPTSAPLNSILVNFYPAKTSSKDPKSMMPAHSDHECEITPHSIIATYSLGATRELTFNAIHSDETDSIDIETNSLYLMTKPSQSWFKHSMLDVDVTEQRFSITMRNVDPLYSRSVAIVGDSNTKEIKFGAGRGNLGEKYPGEKIKAARIKDIDPRECVGYSNIVIVCGTNDLRPEYNPDVTELSQLLFEKVRQLRDLNPLSKIILMPVLPTRNRAMNKNIMAFNRLVGKWVVQQRDSFIVNPNVQEFLDDAGLMSKKWVREGDFDGIHLGPAGLCKFISIIKLTIFNRAKLIKDINSQQKRSKSNQSGSRKPV